MFMSDKKVRLLTQISGTRDGQTWPEPGTVIMLPQAEADMLISAGNAAETDAEPGEKVLVPPQGIHTPGKTAMGDTQPLVEAPADAVSDPEGVKDALQARAEGDYTEVPVGAGVQQRSGAALTKDQLDKSVEREEAAQSAFAGGTVGETAPDTAKKTAPAADKTTK